MLSHFYQQSIHKLEKSELKRLSAVAKTLSLQISADEHWELSCSAQSVDSLKDSPTYESMHELLKFVQEVNELSTPIYTLYREGICEGNPSDGLIFGVSSGDQLLGQKWESATNIHYQQFETGTQVPEYYDEHGHWLSAFEPILNEDGEPIAVVQVDEMFCSFVQETRAELVKGSLLSLFILFVVCAVFLLLNRLILRAMNQINTELDDQVAERTEALDESNQALAKLNRDLENRVRERTSELKELNLQLSKSNKQLQSFAHVVSHDLKAPLKTINAFGQLLTESLGKDLKTNDAQFLSYINESSRQMSVLISDILQHSLPTGETDKREEIVRLAEVVEQVKQSLSYAITQSGAVISHNQLPCMSGYKSDFIQLFQNLISNSINYRKATVTPVINISYEALGDRHQISFSDNGVGISESALASIFDLFDRAGREDSEGHGIGLTTCCQIMERYNGSIAVSSEQHVGTTFTCTFVATPCPMIGGALVAADKHAV